MNGALTRDDILQLLTELADKLRSRRVRGHVYIVGGAAMIFGFRRERTTHDVDARIENDKEAVLAAIAEVAADHDELPADWLNENATLFMPHRRDPRPMPVFNTPDLVVTGASAEHLLAMKLEAGRETDVDDVRTLVDNLNIRSESEAIAIHDAIFPHTPLRGNGLEILHKAMETRRTDQATPEKTALTTEGTAAAVPPRPPAPARGAAEAADRATGQRGPSRS